ncbi:N-6 DNA methylase [Stutzerimonas xanthomarina]|uniref:class I SAM-dependent DNA methyltransferase n=1 Tax=Stutzerimonas xanthomarina TaxID=271420 RepID=UPI003AA99E6F
MSLQQKIDRITDILRRDDGISGAMHYTEQTSWVLFLKFLDDYESEKKDEAVLSGKDYQPVLDDEHRWASWACPKTAESKLDLARAKTGDDLTDYVNNQLFPYLKSFANTAATRADPKSFTYKIGALFQYLDNKVASGHTLREVLDIVDSLNFQSESDLFELSLVYEGLLQNMGDAGGYAGEFYTPRPVVRAMVQAVDPKPGQTIYDAAAGSCGFLVEAFEYLKSRKSQLSTEQWDFIQRDTFFGFEKTSLAYVMGMMNMILHGIESPNLFRGNTLTQNIRDIQEKDRYNIILANPPFGGREKSQIQQNFPIQSNATELLFLQHFMKTLKSGGKAAIVVPEGVLFQTNSAFKQVKQELLENFNLHTILSLPVGVFLPYSGVKTNVLFFERSGGTTDVWYYECEPVQKLTKNKPITDDHLKDFVELYSRRETTDRSWTVSASKLSEDYDLSAKNPAKQKDAEHLAPNDILKQIRTKEKLVSGLLDEIEDLLAEK